MRKMKKMRLLATVLLLSLITFGAAGATSAAGAQGSRLTGFAGPARDTGALHGAHGTGPAYMSRNWDGYITYDSSEGTDFDVVKAEWTQPTVTCPKPSAWTVFWVGLDGWYDDTVEQGGTSAQCVDGVPQYMAWWEMYPTNAITTVFSVNPGDKISASVVYEPSTQKFQITVTDLTTGQSLSKDKSCASDLTCSRSSADVITEDVGHFGSDSFFPLANYGTMKYKSASITDVSDNVGGISDSNWSHGSVTEESGGVTYATVSGLNSSGNGFETTWQHK
jgi:hypothetical protein